MNRTAILAVTVWIFALTAQAELVPFSLRGTVDDVLRTPPGPFTNVKAGDPFEVNFLLRDDTPDQDSVDHTGTFNGAHQSYEVIINGVSASTVLGGVNTVNANAEDMEDLYAIVGIFDDFSTSVSFSDFTGNAIGPEDDLSTIELSGFVDRKFQLTSGQLPSLTGTVIVPEPASVLLAMIGVIGLISNRRRRS